MTEFIPAIVGDLSFKHKPTRKQLKIMERHKTQFPNDEDTLRAHLSRFELEYLAPYLVWILPQEFNERQQVGDGTFGVVERAAIKKGKNMIKVALKTMKYDELNSELKNELLYNIHLRFNGDPRWMPTPQLIGLSMTKEQKYSLVMQYAAGGTLEYVLRRIPPRSWLRVWQIAMEITRRLQVIHEAGLVHCDLHPGNIVFDRSGDDSIPLIIDVGASKPLSQFRVELAVGRFAYLPPEFFRFGPPTQRYDIYDLGILLWQLTARFPPRGNAALPWGVITDPANGLREEVVPGTPDCYCELYRDCWRSDPFSRPTAAEVLRRLTNCKAAMMAAPWFDTILEAKEYFTRREEEFVKEESERKLQAQTKSTTILSSSFTFASSTRSDSYSTTGMKEDLEEENVSDENLSLGGKVSAVRVNVRGNGQFFSKGKFPDEWFLMKSQHSDLFLGVKGGSEFAGAKLTIEAMRPEDHASQLWKFHDGFLINKKSRMALDLKNGSLNAGSKAIQQTVRKPVESVSQQWGLTFEGYIYTSNSNSLVLGTKKSRFGKDHVYLLDKKDVKHEKQRWNFVVPMPKDPSKSVTLISRKAQFPGGWFYIKNQSSNLVLDVKHGALKAGENIITTKQKKKDYESQLWQFRDGQLVNKKSGLAIHVKAGNLKALTEVIQYTIKSKDNTNQLFGLTPEGHIFVQSKPNLVLGFKGGLFDRREDARVNLQIQDKSKKGQRWNFVVPVFKINEEVKTAVSIKHVSTKYLATAQGTFPEEWFFVKSQNSGFFLGLEGGSETAGEKLTIDAMRPKDHTSQLWKFRDGFLINKKSGLVLDLENGSFNAGSQAIQQTVRNAAESASQQWGLTIEGYIYTKNSNTLVLGTKESFGKGEGAHVYLLDKKDVEHKEQRWNFVVPIIKPKDPSVGATLISRPSYQTQKFPVGWLFIKNRKFGLVIGVSNATKEGAKIVASALDKNHYETQLWKYEDGFLWNKASKFVLDVRGNKLRDGTKLIQYTAKTSNTDSQHWGLTVEGFIFNQGKPSLVLALKDSSKVSANIYLQIKKSHDHKEQCWDFFIPDIKIRHFARFPEGWFFIRSTVEGHVISVQDASSEAGAKIVLRRLSITDYQSQLWTYRNGYLINFKTKLVLDIAGGELTAGAHIIQYSEKKLEEADNQLWALTVEGQIVNQKQHQLVLGVEDEATARIEDSVVGLHEKKGLAYKEQRWGFLLPVFESSDSGRQVISKTEEAVSKSYDEPKDTAITKTVVNKYGLFPEGWFFIRSHKGLVLGIERDSKDIGTRLVLRTLNYKVYTYYLWSYRNRFLVNRATNCVIDVQGGALVNGAQLIQYEQKSDEPAANQLWSLTVDGFIFNRDHPDLVFAVADENATSMENSKVQLLTKKDGNPVEQRWSFFVPIFGKRKVEGTVTSTETEEVIESTEEAVTVLAKESKPKIVQEAKKKVIVKRYGLFPEGNFLIKNGVEGLVLTVEGESLEQGAKIVLRKLNTKAYQYQLWTFKNGYLINPKSKYVLDISQSNVAALAEQKDIDSATNQQWGLTIEGYIFTTTAENLVLGVENNVAAAKEGTQVRLYEKQEGEYQVQCWHFLVPVFGKKKAPAGSVVVETTPTTATETKHHDDEIFETATLTTLAATAGGALAAASGETHEEEYEDEEDSDDEEEITKTSTTTVTTIINTNESEDSGESHNDFGEFGEELTSHDNSIVQETVTGQFVIRRYALFPSGWFFIKNLSDNLLITIEGEATHQGAKLVLRRLSKKSWQYQLWTYRNGYLINYKTKYVIDNEGGNIQSGTCIIQWEQKPVNESGNQIWGLTEEGYIYNKQNNKLLLAVEDDVQARTEGSQLRIFNGKTGDYKEQQWGFLAPVFDRRSSSEAEVILESTSETIIVSASDKESFKVETTADSETELFSLDRYVAISTGTIAVVAGTAAVNEAFETKSETSTPTFPTGVVREITSSNKSIETIVETVVGAADAGAIIQEISSAGSSKTTETISASSSTERHENVQTVIKYRTVAMTTGAFPEGWFYIRLVEQYVLSVENGSCDRNAKVYVARIKTSAWESQLWSFRDGYLINKHSSLYLTIENGDLIQTTAKPSKKSSSQQWALTVENCIYSLCNKSYYLGAKQTAFGEVEFVNIYSLERTYLNTYSWTFLIPIFGKRTEEEITEVGIEEITEDVSEITTTDSIITDLGLGLSALGTAVGAAKEVPHGINETIFNLSTDSNATDTKISKTSLGEKATAITAGEAISEVIANGSGTASAIPTSDIPHVSFRCVFDEDLAGIPIDFSRADREFNSTVENQGTEGAIDIAVVAAAQSDRCALITSDTNYFFSIPNTYGIVVLWGKAEDNRMFSLLKPQEQADAVRVLFNNHMQELEKIYATSDRVLAFWSETKDKDGITRTRWELRQPKEEEMVSFVQKYMREQYYGGYEDSTLNSRGS